MQSKRLSVVSILSIFLALRDDDCHGRMEYAKGLKYESKEWFYGKITRSEAENWLGRFADHGDFLIRQSETNVSILYSM